MMLPIYDLADNRIRRLTALGAAQDREYDMLWEYDHAGNVCKETNALGQSVKTDYDVLGNRVAMWDYSGHKTNFVYDALSRLLAQDSPFDTRRTKSFSMPID